MVKVVLSTVKKYATVFCKMQSKSNDCIEDKLLNI